MAGAGRDQYGFGAWSGRVCSVACRCAPEGAKKKTRADERGETPLTPQRLPCCLRTPSPPSGNEFASEAVPGALPVGRNSPQVKKKRKKRGEKERNSVATRLSLCQPPPPPPAPDLTPLSPLPPPRHRSARTACTPNRSTAPPSPCPAGECWFLGLCGARAAFCSLPHPFLSSLPHTSPPINTLIFFPCTVFFSLSSQKPKPAHLDVPHPPLRHARALPPPRLCGGSPDRRLCVRPPDPQPNAVAPVCRSRPTRSTGCAACSPGRRRRGGVPGRYAIHVYAASADMGDTCLGNADGDFLVVPQQGRLHITTELGRLSVAPGEAAILPRGLRFSVALPDGTARGYVLEVFGGPFSCPTWAPSAPTAWPRPGIGRPRPPPGRTGRASLQSCTSSGAPSSRPARPSPPSTSSPGTATTPPASTTSPASARWARSRLTTRTHPSSPC